MLERLRPDGRQSHPLDYLNDIRKRLRFFPRAPVRIPLAICLNTLERSGVLLEQGPRVRDWYYGIREAPISRALDRAIPEEIRAGLGRGGAGRFLEHDSLSFPRHQFFTRSALGDAAPQPLPTPLLVDRPVVWLLEQSSLLRT